MLPVPSVLGEPYGYHSRVGENPIFTTLDMNPLLATLILCGFWKTT